MDSLETKRTFADKFAMPTLLAGFATVATGALLNIALGNGQRDHWSIIIVGIGLTVYIVGRVLQMKRKRERQN